jgi:gentisate 1,2-dioxygenase
MTLAIDTAQAGNKHNITGARQAYYDMISKYHLAPLWEVLRGLVTPEPKTQMQRRCGGSRGREAYAEAAMSSPPRRPSAACSCWKIPRPGKSRITNTLLPVSS